MKVDSMINAPRPTFAPIHSPTIAPITQVVAAILRAENRNGSDDGRRIFQNTSDFEALRIRASSSVWGMKRKPEHAAVGYEAGKWSVSHLIKKSQILCSVRAWLFPVTKAVDSRAGAL